jgi:hypothetical protein
LVNRPEPERNTVVLTDKRASTQPERKIVVLTDERASTEPTVVLTNTDFADSLLRAAVRDLDDFLKRYADLRQHQPMLESDFEKIEEAVRRLRADRP